jgi:hypothetical protein
MAHVGIMTLQMIKASTLSIDLKNIMQRFTQKAGGKIYTYTKTKINRICFLIFATISKIIKLQ